MKLCKTCQINKDESNYYKRGDSNFLRTDCKQCWIIKTRIRSIANPEANRKASLKCLKKKRLEDPNYERRPRLKRQFNLSIEEYNKILEAQDNCCAICWTVVARKNSKQHFDVDHEHVTGRVRGLLCSNCNKGLGLFKDSSDILLRAAKYLDETDPDYLEVFNGTS